MAELEEIGQLYNGGSVLIPHDDIWEWYERDQWIAVHQRNGGVVMRRRIIVVEGWGVVPRA